MSSNPETAGSGVSLPVPADIPTPVLFEVLKHSVDHPEGYFPAKDVITRPSDDGKGTYREMTVIPTGDRVRENVYSDGLGEVRYVLLGDVVEIVGKITDDGEGNRSLEFFKRNTATGERVPWEMPYVVAQDGIQNLLNAAQKLVDGVPLQDALPSETENPEGADQCTGEIGMGISAPIATDVTNESVFEVLKHKIYHPDAYLPAKNVRTMPSEDGVGVYREMTMPDGTVMKENIYHDNSREVKFVVVDEDVEHVNKISDERGKRVLEFFMRSTSTGERVPWPAPRDTGMAAIHKVLDTARSLQNGVPLPDTQYL